MADSLIVGCYDPKNASPDQLYPLLYKTSAAAEINLCQLHFHGTKNEAQSWLLYLGFSVNSILGANIISDICNGSIMYTPFADQHQPIAYWALLDSGHVHNSAVDKVLSVACPVDVIVYDKNNTVVAEIRDDQYEQFILEHQDTAFEIFVDENGTKQVFIPSDGDYRVELVATGSGKMDYSITEYEGDSADKRVYYKDVPLTAGKEFSESIPKDNDINENDYNLSTDGGEIRPTTVLEGDEIGNIDINVQSSEGGFVTGIEPSYTIGDSASFTAVANSNYKFTGWYEEEVLISTEATYGFIVDESDNSRTVTAKFSSAESSSCNHQFGDWYITTGATELAEGQQSRKCSVCGKTESRTISQIAPTLPSVKISKPKATKRSATIKWKKVSKKNLKKIKNVQVQVSPDPNFIFGVVTKYVSAKKTSIKIKKLTSKKKYYVRVRAYTKSGGVVQVSKWSSRKTVKVK